MRITQLLYTTASGLVLLAAGVIVFDLFAKHKFLPTDVLIVYEGPKGSAGPQSPIRVVGGSISPLAKSGWTPCGNDTNGHVTCLVSADSVDTTALSTDADLPTGHSEEPVAWLGSNYPWTVSVFSWNGANAYGIKICPSATNVTPSSCVSSAKTGTSILLQIIGSGPYFVSDSPDTNDNTYFLYYDPQATISNYYEHIKNIQIAKIDADTNGSSGTVYTYRCTNGRCNIYIGQ
jgi:hypothetical protein